MGRLDRRLSLGVRRRALILDINILGRVFVARIFVFPGHFEALRGALRRYQLEIEVSFAFLRHLLDDSGHIGMLFVVSLRHETVRNVG
jgi:hypothetical protein